MQRGEPQPCSLTLKKRCFLNGDYQRKSVALLRTGEKKCKESEISAEPELRRDHTNPPSLDSSSGSFRACIYKELAAQLDSA